MRVEQAVYGEIAGRGHGLRTSSMDASFASTIASKLDLPDSVPPGVQTWSPFVRGFPINDRYVLARTFLDSSASRGGMVLTHALIVSLDEICEVSHLAMFFGCLASSATDCPSSVEALEVDTAVGIPGQAADLIGIANALSAQGLAPVVQLGVDGFESIVDSLWSNLWPALRRNFAFRLSFGPNDVVEQPTPAIVCSPEQLQARWTNYRITKSGDRFPDSESARILCGQLDVKPILSLAEKLGLEVHTFKELNRLERLHALLASGENLDDFLAAVRLVDGLSSQPKIGTTVKEELIGRLTALVAGMGCKQLLLMRNLTLPGFSNTQPLWSAVELFVSNLEFFTSDDSDLIEIVAASVDETLASPPWRVAVTAGLSAAACRDKPAISLAIWRWAERSESTFAVMLGTLPNNSAVERRLAAGVPKKLRVTTPAALLKPLLRKRWLIAYGAVLASTLPALGAVGQQLKVDKSPDHIAGLKSALRYAEPHQALECMREYKDSRLVQLCADLAVANPQILCGIRCDEITEQHLWGASIAKDFSLWSAPSNPIGARDTVLAQLAEGKPVDASLLEALAKTPLSDLSTAPERARLWSLLPAPHVENYMQATANGWLKTAVSDLRGDPPEPDLERAIISSPSLGSVLESPSVAVDTRLSIIGALSSFPEDRFIAWMNGLLLGVRAISHEDSERLGALIAFRRWGRAAKFLAERFAGQRQDLMPGLRLCAGLLGFFSCWKLGISKPSISEKWRAFEEEAQELYPSGPDHSELWSRAGGRNSDLPGKSQNGATRWHTTLHEIRYGSRPSARELLAVMCKDFASNEKLRLYASDTDIVGWR